MALTDGLVSYYKMDTGSGTTAFDSVGTNDGSISGATWTTGKINGGLSFDGSNDYIVYNSTDFLPRNNLTVNFWINLDNLPVSQSVIFDGDFEFSATASNDNGFAFGINTNGTLWSFYQANLTKNDGGATTGILTTLTWHMGTLVREGGTIKMYIDGVLDKTTTGLSTANITYTGNYRDNRCYWMAWEEFNNGIFRHLDGKLDEAGIWNRALTSTEVSELYNNGDGLQYGQPGFGGDVIKRTNIFFKNN